MSKPKVGVVGTGNISKAYFKNIARLGVNEVVACADLDLERAKAKAAEFNIPRVLTAEQILADPEIEYVLNLTPPAGHEPIARAALQAGKHIYNEKPLAVTRQQAQSLRQLAAGKGLRIGCAPDTILGAAMQTCRQVIDAGKIGQPIAAEILFSLYPGPRSFESFFWKAGAGVLMDMGPYYLQALAMLLGPATRVTGFARKNPAPQLQAKDPDWRSKVEVPSHVAAVVDFASGVMANMSYSYEVPGHYDIFFRIQGTEATLHMPDPNMFHGTVRITAFGKEKETVAVSGPLAAESRGIGLAEMTEAIAEKRPHRVNDEIAYHVLDIMVACVESAEQEKAIHLTSTMTRPEPYAPALVTAAASA